MPFVRGAIGLFVLMAIAWALSSDRRRFPVKVVIGGMALQFALAFLVLKTETGRAIFDGVGYAVTFVLKGADKGAEFVFVPFAGKHPDVIWRAIAGVKIMSTVIIVSTLASIGYHLGVLQRVVAAMAFVMTRLLGISGAESLSGAANVFLGQTEAPLLVRPYLTRTTRSELMAIMTCGFATIAMGVMALYIDWLGVDATGQATDAARAAVARHLLTASLMSAPAGFILAKIMVPETGTPDTFGHATITIERTTRNVLDAASTGASQGMTLAINILAMLIAFIALIHIIDLLLAAISHGAAKLSFTQSLVQPLGGRDLSLSLILGWLFSPIAWCLGVDSADTQSFGSLLGTAMAANEMVAYNSLTEMVKTGGMNPRSIQMAMYSMCGFANFSSMGIQIGGIGAMVPDRRTDLVQLAPRAMLGGAMASWMTGCIAGMFV